MGELDPPETFANQKINEISRIESDSTWNEQTQISEKIPLYDSNETLNGYIFNLNNNNIPCGYIQIALIDNTYDTIGYAFHEKHFISNEIEKISKSKNVNKSKLIYIGNFDYLFASPAPKRTVFSFKNKADTKYFNVSLNKETEDKAAIDEQSDAYVNSVKENLPSKKTARANTMTANKVSNYSTSDFSLQADYNGKTFKLSNGNSYKVTGESPICSPNAGVNLIKYWGQRRGVSNLWYSSDWWVFSSLIQTMNFRSDFMGVGTTESGFLSGMKKYCTSIRGVTYDGSNFERNPTFTRLKALIDEDIPFQATIKDAVGYGIGLHSITCYGYNQPQSGSVQLIFNDGYTRYLTYQALSTLKLQSISYIRWN